jgi:putative ABC transport system permease protein
MLQNYFKLALRNLLKNPMFTALNLVGLACGMSISLLLFLHIRQETSFDKFHLKSARIHRVMLNAFWDPEKPEKMANVPNAVAPIAKAEIPAVEQSARLLKHEFGKTAFITAGDKKLVEENLYWADPSLFQIFDFQAIEGDLNTALSRPNTVALSRSAAIRYFGTSNPVGQSIKIDSDISLEVKAIYEDLPSNSTLDAAVLGSFQSVKWASKNLTWSNSSFETWFLLNADAQKQAVEQQLAALLDKNVAKEEQNYTFWLQPLLEAHFHSADVHSNYSKRIGDPKQVGILSALALAVLLMACFNYMNLSTARAQLRYRDVGINKTMGASKKQLSTRFFIETGILTSISMLFAIIMCAIGIPFFNHMADLNLTFKQLFSQETMLYILGITLFVSFFAGSYPAFFLSSFSPKNLLQTAFRKDTQAGWLRQTLVTVQFSASVVLVIGTLVFFQQMKFVQQKKLGFEPQQVVALTTVEAESEAQVNALANACLSLAEVQSVCCAQSYPGQKTSTRSLFKNINDENGYELLTNRATKGIEKVLGMTLLAGSGLPEKTLGDTIVHVLLSKKAVDYLGFTPEEAIGQKVYCNLDPNSFICGVVDDFHAQSLHNPLGAFAFHDAKTESRRYLLVKMDTKDVSNTMKLLEKNFQTALPQSAFEYKFLDEYLDSLYRSDKRTAQVVYIFSLLSILISCLGLFGLAAFAAEQRTKEIGIRKVLGASIAGITGLLAKDFLKLVLIAIVIASPIAYYFMQQWLSDFAYRIDIQAWMFVAAGFAAVLIAFLTVGFQSVKAALANPVKSLRSE